MVVAVCSGCKGGPCDSEALLQVRAAQEGLQLVAQVGRGSAQRRSQRREAAHSLRDQRSQQLTHLQNATDYNHMTAESLVRGTLSFLHACIHYIKVHRVHPKAAKGRSPLPWGQASSGSG